MFQIAGSIGCESKVCVDVSSMAMKQDTLSEWLRRWARNPLGSARKDSNPLGVALPFVLAFNLFELDSVAGAPLQLCDRCRIWRGAPSRRNGKRMNIIQQVCQPPAGIACDHTLTKRMLYQLS